MAEPDAFQLRERAEEVPGELGVRTVTPSA